MHEFSSGEFTVFSSLFFLFLIEWKLSETVNYIRLATSTLIISSCLLMRGDFSCLTDSRGLEEKITGIMQREISGSERDIIKIYCNFLS